MDITLTSIPKGVDVIEGVSLPSFARGIVVGVGVYYT